jgi:hypothetical protein
MSKIISVVLVLVLFFGTTINCFADNKKPDNNEVLLLVFGGLSIVPVLIALMATTGVTAEAETPDDGIRLVSAEEKTPIVNTDGKNILTIIKRVEAGVTPNKDIYIGFRFRY